MMTKKPAATSKRLAALVLSLLLAASLALGGCRMLGSMLDQELAPSPSTQDRTTQDRTPDALLDEIALDFFRYEICLDTLGLNQMVSSPANIGIVPPKPTLGEYTLEGTQADNEFYRGILKRLAALDTAALDETDKLDAAIIKEVLEQTLEYEQFFYYGEPLAPDMGVHAQLPSALLEYQFRNKSDIETYLALLADVPRYFAQLEAFERTKAERGLLMNKSCFVSDLEAIDNFMTPVEQNVLIKSFSLNLDSAREPFSSLSAEERQAFREQNAAAVADSVYPAYASLRATLATLSEQASNNVRVFDYPRGTEYYELAMRIKGFDRSPVQAAQLLEVRIDDYFDTLVASTNVLSGLTPSLPGMNSPYPAKDALDYLSKACQADFPKIEQFAFTVEKTPEELPNDLALAYYKSPAIDDPDDNRIYYYPENVTDDISYLMTLAHEGFPGHMYQSNYYRQTKPRPVRELITSIAYMEGYAMYAELNATRYLGLSEAESNGQIAYDAFLYSMHARIDIGVNFEGWSREQVKGYLAIFSLEDMTEAFFSKACEQPGIYLPYGLGQVEFAELFDHAKEQLGNSFSKMEFNDAILRGGPLPMGMLKDRVDVWIREQKGLR